MPGEPSCQAVGSAVTSPFGGRAWQTSGPTVGDDMVPSSGTVPEAWAGPGQVEGGDRSRLLARDAGFQAEGLAGVRSDPFRGPSAVGPRSRCPGGRPGAVELLVEAAANLAFPTFRPSPMGSLGPPRPTPRSTASAGRPRPSSTATSRAAADIEVLCRDAAGAARWTIRGAPALRTLERAVDATRPERRGGDRGDARDVLAPVAPPASSGQRAPHRRRRACPHRLCLAVAGAGDRPQVHPHVRLGAAAYGRLPGLPVRLLAGAAVRLDAQRHPAVRRDRGEGRGPVDPGRRHVGGDRRQPAQRGAIVRQLVHGQRFFEEHFGRWCGRSGSPTCSATRVVPQIFAAPGCDSLRHPEAVLEQGEPLPAQHVLVEGIDGSRVLTHFPPVDTYNAEVGPAELRLQRAELPRARLERLVADAVRVWQRGRRSDAGDDRAGGGWPTSTDRLRLALGTPDEFFSRSRRRRPGAPVPVWHGELYFEMHRGTFTSQRDEGGQPALRAAAPRGGAVVDDPRRGRRGRRRRWTALEGPCWSSSSTTSSRLVDRLGPRRCRGARQITAPAGGVDPEPLAGSRPVAVHRSSPTRPEAVVTDGALRRRHHPQVRHDR